MDRTRRCGSVDHSVVGRIPEFDRDCSRTTDVRHRLDPTKLLNMTLTSSNGRLIPLSQVGQVVVKSCHGRLRADIVVDGIGGEVLSKALKALALGGSLTTLG
jgi:hypothetical protein